VSKIYVRREEEIDTEGMIALIVPRLIEAQTRLLKEGARNIRVENPEREYISSKLVYETLETDKECELRMEREQAKINRELKELARLKNKYE
jgi:hypothetical protein